MSVTLDTSPAFTKSNNGSALIAAGQEIALPQEISLTAKERAAQRKAQERQDHLAAIESRVGQVTTPQHVICVLNHAAQICELRGWLNQRRTVRDDLDVVTKAVRRNTDLIAPGSLSLLLNMLRIPNLSLETAPLVSDENSQYSVSRKIVDAVLFFDERRPSLVSECPMLHDIVCRLVCTPEGVCCAQGPFFRTMRDLMFKWGRIKPAISPKSAESQTLLSQAGERGTRHVSTAYNLGASPAARNQLLAWNR
jgi:hypothetical protein